MSVTLPHAATDPTVERPPQFGLRTMLLGVTLLSIAFAVSVAVGPARSAMLFLFVSLIVLHVVGNALGTRLRDHREREAHALRVVGSDDRPVSGAAPPIAAAQRLQENTSIGRPWLVAGAVCAMLFGSVGGIAIAALVGEKLTVPGLALGIGSSAVLGGFFGFMACSLWSVARNALREALETMDARSPIANDVVQDQTGSRG